MAKLTDHLWGFDELFDAVLKPANTELGPLPCCYGKKPAQEIKTTPEEAVTSAGAVLSFGR